MRTVAITFDPRTSFLRGIINGVRQYAASHEPWQLLLTRYAENAVRSYGLAVLERADGVICWRATPEMEHLNAVRVFGLEAEGGIPVVLNDFVAVGRLAAEHLMNLGVRSFAALVGTGGGIGNVGRRITGFDAAVRAAGFEPVAVCDVQAPPVDGEGRWSLPDEIDRIVAFLKVQRTPLGVLAVEPRSIWRLLMACEQAGLRVPDDVAVICGEDDRDIFEAFQPAVSGVRYDNERVGYLAAQAVHQLMDGGNPPPLQIVAPLGVEARASTDVLAIDDEVVRDALHFIRSHVADALCVGDILDAFPVARRTLGRRMKRHLGHGPAEEIRRSRVARARHLLTMTDLPLSQVAARSGFVSPSQMGRYVKQATGMTPAAHRRPSPANA